MENGQKYRISYLILLLITILCFALSAVSYVFKIIAFGTLTAGLAMISIKYLKEYKGSKNRASGASIDEMLANDGMPPQTPQSKQSFAQKSEKFGNSLVPYALLFFTFISLCIFIILLV